MFEVQKGNNFIISFPVPYPIIYNPDVTQLSTLSFIGAHVATNLLVLVTDYASRSLETILENVDIKLDQIYITSFVNDLVEGMRFLHYSTQLGVHGNLR